jgi:hypothetical protein
MGYTIVTVGALGISAMAWTQIAGATVTPTNEYEHSAGSPADYLAIDGQLGLDQMAIVEATPGHYVVVLKGVRLDSMSMYNGVPEAMGEELVHWGPYSEAVLLAIRENIPEGSSVAFVGHSQGGLVALNVSDHLSGYQIGPVLTVGSPVGGDAAEHPNLLALINQPGASTDPVPLFDLDLIIPSVLGHDLPDNVVIVDHREPGSSPHDMVNYERAAVTLGESSSPEVASYLENMRPFESAGSANVRVFTLGVG